MAAAGAFVPGDAALDAGDRILHDENCGSLLYDSDGTGDAAARIATLAGGPPVTASDFVVI